MTYLADIFSNQAVLMQRVTDLESMLHGALQRIIDLEKRPPCHCDSCKEMRLYQAERPEPVPEWRRLVDEHSRHVGGDPLYIALDAITTIQRGIDALSTDSRKANLARIVAVCEAQVGDGWQANPGPPRDGILIPAARTTWTLMQFVQTPYAGEYHPNDNAWRALGNRAAAWLRDLTEDGAQ